MFSTAAGKFAADCQQLMTVLHTAIPDNDVLGWRRKAPGILVPARLDGNRVVALIEQTIFDEHILAHLGVDAVVVMSPGMHRHTPDDNMLRHEWVDDPKRTILN